jgi:hypothetical protein
MRPELTRPRPSPIAARLLAAGWRPAAADLVAARIEQREADDPRRSCVDCAYYRAALHLCGNNGPAGLHTDQVGRDLAGLLQHCAGFLPRPQHPAEAPARPAAAVDETSPAATEPALIGQLTAVPKWTSPTCGRAYGRAWPQPFGQQRGTDSVLDDHGRANRQSLPRGAP